MDEEGSRHQIIGLLQLLDCGSSWGPESDWCALIQRLPCPVMRVNVSTVCVGKYVSDSGESFSIIGVCDGVSGSVVQIF